MKLSIKGLALALGIVWGILAMFLTGLLNLLWPSYGRAFLEVMTSVYPGYRGTPEMGQVIVGALYGLVDGAIAGAILAWLYNRFARA